MHSPSHLSQHPMAMGRRGVMLLGLHLDLLLKGRERWHWGMSRWGTRIKVLVCYS